MRTLLFSIAVAATFPAFAWAAGHGGGGMPHGAGGMTHGAGAMTHGAGGMIHGAAGTTHCAAGMTHGAGTMSHGADVSAAAHTARLNGDPVGQSVRSVARSNSQGPAHASTNAISHVQNSPGRAASNSVLGGSTPTTTAITKSKVKGTKGKTKTVHAH